MKLKTLIAAATIAVALAICPASALAYSGPWDSAHQPLTISNPGVSVTFSELGQTGSYTYDIEIADSVVCPSHGTTLTVTMADPVGQTSVSNTSSYLLIDGDGICLPGMPSSAVSSESGSPDFTSGVFTGVEDTEPFFYQVSDSSGVLAQGAYTQTEIPMTATIIDQWSQPDAFINTCIDGGYTIHSMNGGDLYCTVLAGGGETFASGWPGVQPPLRPPCPACAPEEPAPCTTCTAQPQTSGS